MVERLKTNQEVINYPRQAWEAVSLFESLAGLVALREDQVLSLNRPVFMTLDSQEGSFDMVLLWQRKIEGDIDAKQLRISSPDQELISLVFQPGDRETEDRAFVFSQKETKLSKAGRSFYNFLVAPLIKRKRFAQLTQLIETATNQVERIRLNGFNSQDEEIDLVVEQDQAGDLIDKAKQIVLYRGQQKK